MHNETSLHSLVDKICSVADHAYVAMVRSDFNSGRIGIVELMHSIATYAMAEPHLKQFSEDPDVAQALDDFRSGRIDFATGEQATIRAASRHL